ncbi:MAG: hypothetical protein LBK99_12075 [Opitutaceae bacterium]|jgi:hypothetical protein|nr:hypothetical protein [Opitutaceae bacterium]
MQKNIKSKGLTPLDRPFGSSSRREPVDTIVLDNIEMKPQENLNYSGASCIQALRKMYGENLEQSDIRDMTDNVLDKSGLKPFDTWRSVARRLLPGKAKHTSELPEFQTPHKEDE